MFWGSDSGLAKSRVSAPSPNSTALVALIHQTLQELKQAHFRKRQQFIPPPESRNQLP